MIILFLVLICNIDADDVGVLMKLVFFPYTCSHDRSYLSVMHISKLLLICVICFALAMIRHLCFFPPILYLLAGSIISSLQFS